VRGSELVDFCIVMSVLAGSSVVRAVCARVCVKRVVVGLGECGDRSYQ